MKNDPYVPALRYSWLTRIYDPIVALTTRERTFRKRLLEQAEVGRSDRVLDLACGTGTFAILIKTAFPEVSVAALDGDPEILALAREKAGKSGVEISFREGMSFLLPYANDEFDLLFSSLFFHHLMPADKVRTLKEVQRVLKPGGQFHVCDWGRPTNAFLWATFMAVRLLDGFEVTRENAAGQLPECMKKAGFDEVTIRHSMSAALGTLNLIAAVKPRN